MVRGLFISTLISLTGFIAVDATGMDEAALRADAQKIFKEKVGPSSRNTARAATAAGQGRNQSAVGSQESQRRIRHSAFQEGGGQCEGARYAARGCGKQPTDEERRQFVKWIGKHKYLAPRDPGAFVIRRLTKTEYANTLRDLWRRPPSPRACPMKWSAKDFSTQFPRCNQSNSSASPTEWSRKSWRRKARRPRPCKTSLRRGAD